MGEIGPFTSYLESPAEDSAIAEMERAYDAIKHPYSSFQLPEFQRWARENPHLSAGLPIQRVQAVYCRYCGSRRRPERDLPTCSQCGAPQRSE